MGQRGVTLPQDLREHGPWTASASGAAAAQGRDPHLRRQERRPAADGRGAADRRARSTLHNVPRLADITTMTQLLEQHGVEVGAAPGENGHARGTTLTLQARQDRLDHGALRPRAQDARLGAGAGPAAGARAARRGSRCPAAAPSARGRSTCTSRAWRRWAPRSSSTTATSMATRAQGPERRARSSSPRSRSARPRTC